ncbi:MAG: beta strand repeat-containing protein, partial [Chthoniobacterales bacterium]
MKSHFPPAFLACALAIAALASLHADTFTVTTTADTGAEGTLRWAITQANANAGSSIAFTDNLGTITLTSALPDIIAATTILGGIGNTVSGNNLYRIFLIDAASSTVTISGLSLVNGRARGGNGGIGGGGGLGAGGAIYVHAGALEVSGISLQGNSAIGGNGGSKTGTVIPSVAGTSSGPVNGNFGVGGVNTQVPGFGGGGAGYAINARNNDPSGGEFGGKGGSDSNRVIGQNDYDAGGGGAGLGGAIFVEGTNGANLTYLDTVNFATNAGTTAGGAGGASFGTGSEASASGAAVGNALFLTGGTTSLSSGTVSASVGISDGANLIKTGPGTLTVLSTLTGYSGAFVTISAGTLQIGQGGALGSISASIVNNGALVLNTTIDTTIGSISGAGSLTNLTGSTLTVTGSNPGYTGTTTISGGILQIGNGSTSGSLGGDIVSNGTVVFNRSDASTYGGAISGSGGVAKLGTGNLTLNGTSTYTGGITVSAGTLTGTSSSLRGPILNNAAVVFDQATDGVTSGVISGSGSLTKMGSGVLTLSGLNTYTGTTTISDGTLLVSDTVRALNVNPALLLDATSLAATSNPVTSWADLSGSGNNATAGGGSVTLGALSTGRAALVFGNNSYFNTPLSSSGSAYTIFSVFEPTTLSGNQTIAGSSQNSALQFRVANNTLGLLSQSVAQLASSSTITNTSPTFATASITSGAQQFYLGTTAAGTGNASYTFSPGATLRIGSNAQVTESFTGKISMVLVYNSVLLPSQIEAVQSAVLAALANGTTLVQPNLATANSYLPTNTAVNITSSTAALGISGLTQTIGSLAGVPGSRVSLASGQLIVGNGTSTTFAGSIEGTGGLTKVGTGTLTLSNASTFQGSVAVNGGTLAVGNDASLGNSANSVTLNGTTLTTNAALTLPQIIQFGASGGTINTNGFNSTFGNGLGTISGAFVKSGNGILTLGGNSTTTTLSSVSVSAGSLSISSGSTLRIGNAGTSGSLGGGSVVADGALVFDRSDSFSNTVTLTGSGTLTKLGSGTATLTGVQNFSGSINITGGLTFSNPISTTSTLSGNITGGSLTKTDSGNLILSGTNSFTSITFTGGTITAGSDGALGSAPLIFNSNGRLGTTAPRTISNPITVSGIAFLDPGLTLSGPMTLGSNPVLIPAATTTGSVIVSGIISGNSGLSIGSNLGSAIILTGANTYTGATTVSSGAVLG